jgi:PleD family two-component response regulator
MIEVIPAAFLLRRCSRDLPRFTDREYLILFIAYCILTGLANRRRFVQVLNTEWRCAFRDRGPLWLLMIDVDLFKSCNDTCSHPSGIAASS